MNVSISKIVLLLSSIFLLSCSNEEDKLLGDWEFEYIEIVDANSGKIIGVQNTVEPVYIRISADSIVHYKPSYIEIESILNRSETELWYKDGDIELRHEYKFVNDTLVFITPGVADLDAHAYLSRSTIPNKYLSSRKRKEINWNEYADVWVYSGIYTSIYGADYGLDSLDFTPIDTLDLKNEQWSSFEHTLFYGKGIQSNLFEFYNDDKGYLSIIPVDQCRCTDIVLQYEKINE